MKNLYKTFKKLLKKTNLSNLLKKFINKLKIKKTLPTKTDKLENIVKNLKDVNSEEIFEYIEPGDIIFAAMPLNLEKLARIPEGHRSRVYIVAKKQGNKLLVYGGTSKKNSYKTYFNLYKDTYNLWKDGAINLDELIYLDKSHIIDILDSLKTIDIMSINNKILKTSKKVFNQKQLIENNSKAFENSVIYKNKTYYFVFKKDFSGTYLAPLSKKKTNLRLIFENEIYYINKNITKLENNESYHVVGTAVYKPIKKYELASHLKDYRNTLV